MVLPSRGERLGSILNQIEDVEGLGFTSAWLAHTIGVDALTVLALAGQRTERLELGSFVVPTYPRHPASLAQQALTAQVAAGGRLVLGVGLSHRAVMEARLGFDWDHPIRHMREYLKTLRGLLAQQAFEFAGQEFVVHSYQLTISDAPAPSILVGALGPQMLRLAGRLADGTALWMGGPRYIANHVVPNLNGAARMAGRHHSRIVAGLPVCVTERPDAVRQQAAEEYKVYGHLPSYRAILDREGVAGPEDVALIGSASEVSAGLDAFAAAGATDFAAVIFATDRAERQATLELLQNYGRQTRA